MKSPVPEPNPPALVIGYGNDLRGDDAAGPATAAAIEHLGLPGVRTLVRHQLTPELAEPISKAGLVIFIDADARQEITEVQVEPVAAQAESCQLSHGGSPQGLLALAEEVAGCVPPAYWVTVPTSSFELGAALSDRARQGVAAAMERIRQLCDSRKTRKAPTPDPAN